MQLHPELVEETLVPDVALGAHTIAWALPFDKGVPHPNTIKQGFYGQAWLGGTVLNFRATRLAICSLFSNGKPLANSKFWLAFIGRPGGKVYGGPADCSFKRWFAAGGDPMQAIPFGGISATKSKAFILIIVAILASLKYSMGQVYWQQFAFVMILAGCCFALGRYDDLDRKIIEWDYDGFTGNMADFSSLLRC